MYVCIISKIMAIILHVYIKLHKLYYRENRDLTNNKY